MKKTLLRRLLLAATIAFASIAHAQDYPAKPIKLIVPFEPGGTTDILARLIAKKLSEKWSQPVIVENRGGAAGNIGAEVVYRAPADGYTLMFTPGGPLAINKILYPHLLYDPDKFVPVSLIAQSPSVLVVSPKLAITNLSQLISFAKTNPDGLNFGSQGNGSVAHLSAESFRLMAGVKMVHIPYKGSAPALAAVLSGEVDMAFLELSGALSQINAGGVRALGVGGEKRNPLLPNVPAISEMLPGFVSFSWFSMVAPPGTPSPIAQKLSTAIAEIVRQPDVVKWMHVYTLDPIGSTTTEMAAFIKKDRQRYGDVIKATGIVME